MIIVYPLYKIKSPFVTLGHQVVSIMEFGARQFPLCPFNLSSDIYFLALQ